MSVEDFIWYEKFRPHSLTDMTLPPKYRKDFTRYISSGEVPHLLLFGPPGSGKTTLGFVIMDSIPCVRLVLNASSSDRGIDTIKGKVKQFAGSETFGGKIKIVFLDEADRLTKEAQDALRNTMETYSRKCRFILTCNEVDAITEAIRSRCIKYEFSSFPVSEVISNSKKILQKEKIKFEEEDLKKIVDTYYPDIRSVVNNLQMCSTEGTLDPTAVSRSSIDPEKILDLILSGNIKEMRSIISGVSTFTYLYRFLFDVFLGAEDLSQEDKIAIASVLAEHLYRDNTVANREINFVACCVSLIAQLKIPNMIF